MAKIREISLTLLITIAIILATVYAVMHTQLSFPNRARVKGVGISIWWDYNCTTKVEYIDWGFIEPNETKTVTLYIKSRSNVNITITMTTENWEPTNASKYIAVTWNREGYMLPPKTVTPVDINLHVFSNITGIDTFNFDIIITATG